MTVVKDRQLTRSFRARELACKCRRPDCDAMPMDPDTMDKAQRLRDLWGRPLIPSSGSRCLFWNAAIGGAPLSFHPQGKAIDFRLETPDDGPKLAALAEKVGFGGIGLAKTFIHVDTGPMGRRWTYAT